MSERKGKSGKSPAQRKPRMKPWNGWAHVDGNGIAWSVRDFPEEAEASAANYGGRVARVEVREVSRTSQKNRKGQ